MGIEEKWYENPELISLRISDAEKKKAREAVEKYMKETGMTPPFKISRKKMGKTEGYEGAHGLDVYPTDEPPGYRIGFLARAKLPQEGILGHGSYGVTKLIEWEDGRVDAIKIQPKGQGGIVGDEAEVMQITGDLIGSHTRDKAQKSEWIRGKLIAGREYTITKRHIGVNMFQYVFNADETEKTFAEVPAEKRIRGCLGAALAFQEFHGYGLIHCDVKSENFIFDEKTGAVGIIDFGFAQKLPAGQAVLKHTKVFGTVFYMAQEIKLRGEYSRASDVYALGVMFKEDYHLAECFTGDLKRVAEKLVSRMCDYYRDSRPSMEEVVATMRFLNASVDLHLGNDLAGVKSLMNVAMSIMASVDGMRPEDISLVADLLEVCASGNSNDELKREADNQARRAVADLTIHGEIINPSVPKITKILKISTSLEGLPEDYREVVNDVMKNMVAHLDKLDPESIAQMTRMVQMYQRDADPEKGINFLMEGLAIRLKSDPSRWPTSDEIRTKLDLFELHLDSKNSEQSIPKVEELIGKMAGGESVDIESIKRVLFAPGEAVLIADIIPAELIDRPVVVAGYDPSAHMVEKMVWTQ